MYAVCVTSWVKAEHAKDYVEACLANARETRKEPGNLRFDLLRCADDPNQFFFYEIYKQEEDFHKHHQTEHYLKWREAVTPWMEKPREGVKYHSIAPIDESDW